MYVIGLAGTRAEGSIWTRTGASGRLDQLTSLRTWALILLSSKASSVSRGNGNISCMYHICQHMCLLRATASLHFLSCHGTATKWRAGTVPGRHPFHSFGADSAGSRRASGLYALSPPAPAFCAAAWVAKHRRGRSVSVEDASQTLFTGQMPGGLITHRTSSFLNHAQNPAATRSHAQPPGSPARRRTGREGSPYLDGARNAYN